MDAPIDKAFDRFIRRWQDADGTERANYQLFLTELTELLDLERPAPAAQDSEDNANVFERRVRFRHADGSESHSFIDLYKRGCFVGEAKQTNKALDGDTWDAAILRAQGGGSIQRRPVVGRSQENGANPCLLTGTSA